MINKLLALIFCIPIIAFAQQKELSVFDNLINKTWEASGFWNDGSEFKQKINFKYSLNNSIVITETTGFINKEQNKLGLRNYGIRQYDKNTNEINFWEFDVFGELTKGTVLADGKNLIYQYKYGNLLITEKWEFINNFTYNFKVGVYKKGAWEQVYLNTKFTRVDTN